ncbi:hypothetical protein, partial [Tropicimonas sp.]|uniref:hypothetical protein n=1 Tax=Tropicimonas sp. TaxID=2067044 RepID=UPI003A8A900E
FFARSTPMMLTSPLDALSYSLCFDTTSLAHRDAVRGERHPHHLHDRIRLVALVATSIRT